MSSKAYLAEVAGEWDEIRSGYFTGQMRDAAIALAGRWLGFAREDIHDWYAAAGLSDIKSDFADGRCSSTTPEGGDIDLSIFVPYGRKG